MTKKVAQKCSGNTKPRTKRSRHICFTSFLDTKPHYDEMVVKYLIFGAEVCPDTGRKHWQGYAYFFKEQSIKSAQQHLKCPDVHMEFCNGNELQNARYCAKDGGYEEFGERPSQGKRTDLIELKDTIMSGEKTVEDIILSDPMLYHMYGRTLNAIEDIRLRQIFRTEMTKCTWFYGSTGSGKSHRAFEGYNPRTHYVYRRDKGWWEGYKQQPYVIINDFRGHIKYDTLLQLIDKWPMSVPRRGREPMPFTSKHILITSPLRPEEIYHNRMVNDSIEQLMRRITLVKCINPSVEIAVFN